MKARLFDLIYAPLTKSHLATIEPQYYSLIREAIEQQLRVEPAVETKNRKPLKRPMLGATWEIRFGPNNRLPVLYAINFDDQQVYVLAIGKKVGQRLWIGGQEIRL